MNVLFVHQNFPGQFSHIADALCARGDTVVAIGGPTARDRAGIALHRWANRRSSTSGLFPVSVRAEADLIRADAAARVALALRHDGFRPDIIIGHPGWGETLHLSDVFPDARVILLGEFYYRGEGADIGFDREFETPSFADAMRSNGKNATLTLALVRADHIVCPTPFQASLLPPIFAGRTSVIHEGIDLDKAVRDPHATITLPDGRRIDRSVPVVTFVNRTFERLRGFHIFMRALPAVMAAVPDVEILLIGDDAGRPYGGVRADGQSWRTAMLAEVGARIDQTRVHFLGHVPHHALIDAFSISAAHVYYTYPFVLSWSLAEAMACECAIVASDTAPVRDAIRHGQEGVLHDFFDVAALSETLIAMLRAPARFDAMRHAARVRALELFDRTSVGIPGWLRIIDKVAAR